MKAFKVNHDAFKDNSLNLKHGYRALVGTSNGIPKTLMFGKLKELIKIGKSYKNSYVTVYIVSYNNIAYEM